MNKISNILFLLKKPKLVIVSGSNSKIIKETAEKTLSSHLKKDEEVLVIENDLENIEEVKFLLKNSPFPVLVLNQESNISLEKIRLLIESIPGQGFLVLNYDEEIIRQIKETSPVSLLSFGFEGRADFYASDIKINGGINLKMNYQGKSVPIWLEKAKWEEQIPSALAVVAIATIFGLNLVEISEALKTPDKA